MGDMFGNEVVVEETKKRKKDPNEATVEDPKKKGKEAPEEDKKDERPQIVRFASSLGIELDLTELKKVNESITVKIANGQEITLFAYNQKVGELLYQYFKMGIMEVVSKEMKEQGEYNEFLLKWVLKEMAEKELRYGLRPLDHVIPLKGRVYIKIDGYRYHARNTGVKYGVSFEPVYEDLKNNKFTYRCIITFSDPSMPPISAEGTASPMSYKGNTEYMRQMAMKRAEMHALAIAFPIGVSVEEVDMIPYDEVNYESARPIGSVIADNLESILGGQKEVVINATVPEEDSEVSSEEAIE